MSKAFELKEGKEKESPMESRLLKPDEVAESLQVSTRNTFAMDLLRAGTVWLFIFKGLLIKFDVEP
jgi:hypothetical protein